MIIKKICKLCQSTRITQVTHTNEYDIFECKYCKIAFTSPPPPPVAYATMDFHSKQDAANTEKLTVINDLPFDWQKVIKAQVALINKNFEKNINVLEIGCGEGIFLEQLKLTGFDHLLGIEPSNTASIRARKRGLEIINDYFSKEIVKRKFDLIILSHVFEHIDNLPAFINELTMVLSPGGSIMFVQTNYKGLIPRIQKEDWYAWVPEQHFWHFTLKGLSKLLSKWKFHLSQYHYTSLVHPHGKLYKLANLKKDLIDQFIAVYDHRT